MSGEIDFEQYQMGGSHGGMTMQDQQQQRRVLQQQGPVYHPNKPHQRGVLDRRAPIVVDTEAMNISFCGCGFLGIYHMGVVAAFRHFLPGADRYKKICGCSAGALAAVGLVADLPTSECIFTLFQ